VEGSLLAILIKRDIALKSIMTVMVIFVVYLRLPELLTEPRFWAEEGTSYFSFAYSHHWLINLLSPQYGYNTLYNSIATSLATIVPLEYAPFVTTYLAFIVQVSVSSAVIWWDIPILDSLFKKFVIAIFIQILAYARIWVTTIGVQYWLCILSFLILLYNHNACTRKVSVLHNCLLVLNGLTGILSCVLLPAFALKYLKTKSRQVMIHTAILSVCLLVQVSVFCYALASKAPGLERRFLDCNLTYMLSKLVTFEFSVPFFGQGLFQVPSIVDMEARLRNVTSIITGPSIFSYQFDMLEIGSGLLILCYLLILTWKKFKQLDTQLIAISLFMVTTISTYFSVNRSGGPRYTFAPSIMIMVLVVSVVNDKTVSKTLRSIAALLVILSLTFSFKEYRIVMMGFAYDPTWPKWEEELRIWKTNPDYLLKIWPPPWQMTLSKR
jgi:hypothetical protein